MMKLSLLTFVLIYAIAANGQEPWTKTHNSVCYLPRGTVVTIPASYQQAKPIRVIGDGTQVVKGDVLRLNTERFEMSGLQCQTRIVSTMGDKPMDYFALDNVRFAGLESPVIVNCEIKRGNIQSVEVTRCREYGLAMVNAANGVIKVSDCSVSDLKGTINAHGILVFGANVEMTGCTVRDVTADNLLATAGLYTKATYTRMSGNTLIDCGGSIETVPPAWGNGAITVKSNGAAVLENNVIHCSADRPVAIVMTNSTNCTAKHNTLHGGSILSFRTPGTTISDNLLIGSTADGINIGAFGGYGYVADQNVFRDFKGWTAIRLRLNEAAAGAKARNNLTVAGKPGVGEITVGGDGKPELDGNVFIEAQ